jgi:hypothetical protein
VTDLRKPVSRRTQLPRGPVVVTLYPDGTIGFRQIRHRVEYRLPLARVFVMAADAHQQTERAMRKLAAKIRRAAK